MVSSFRTNEITVDVLYPSTAFNRLSHGVANMMVSITDCQARSPGMLIGLSGVGWTSAREDALEISLSRGLFPHALRALLFGV